MDINLNVKHYFYNPAHKNVILFFFTSDGYAFTDAGTADNHVRGLQDKTVTPITRAEVTAWWAENAPKLLAGFEKNVADAIAEREAADKAVAALGKTASAQTVAKAKWAASQAAKKVVIAEGELAECKAGIESGEQGAESEDDNDLELEVTQEILDLNPDMITQGFKIGDKFTIPKDATQTSAEEIKEDVKAAVVKQTLKKAPAKKSAKKK